MNAISPRMSASQRPSIPAERAPLRSPAPSFRAVVAVAVNRRKLKIATAAVKIADDRDSPASCEVPRCPTMAESMRMNNGWAMSAPRAGTARLKICRSRARP